MLVYFAASGVLVFAEMERITVSKRATAPVKKQSLWARLGPGLITGAADDEPPQVLKCKPAAIHRLNRDRRCDRNAGGVWRDRTRVSQRQEIEGKE